MEPTTINVIIEVLAMIGIAFFVNHKIIPEYEKRKELNKKLESFHQKYFQKKEAITKSKLQLKQHYKICEKIYSSYGKNRNITELREVPQRYKTSDDFKDFVMERKKFLSYKTDFINSLMNLIYLLNEEYFLMNKHYDNKKVVSQILLWLNETDKELRAHFSYLDELCQKPSGYVSIYNRLGLRDYLRNILLATEQCFIDKQDQDTIDQIISSFSEKHATFFTRNDFKMQKVTYPSYKRMQDFFNTISDKNGDEVFEHFWVDEDTYLNLLEIKAS